MRIFVTGASGHVASAVIPELLAAGHTVTGLVRSDRAAAVVRSLGAEVRHGDLDDTDALTAAVQEADGVIHLAFNHEQQNSGDLDGAVATDLRAVRAIGTALAGSDKPFVGTNATAGMVLLGFEGELTERDTLPGGPRVDAENAVIALSKHGVRSSVVRLPPAVHYNARYGFVSGLIDIARATGTSGYVGTGDNRWPSSDTRDVARLYRHALESAPAGARLHAVAEGGIPVGEIAETIGHRLDVPVTSIAAEDAKKHFGYLSAFIGLDNPTANRITLDALGWAPIQPGLIAALERDREPTSKVGATSATSPHSTH